MSKKSVRPANRPQSSPRQEAADCINRALLYNISDLAQKSGVARPSIHRAFAGNPIKPNFTTVFNVLDAMGFRLHVTVRPGARARAARLKSDENCQEPER